ncbi:MAG: hypothetical protein R3292_09375 [Alcanivorax sp.]|nr:hypothetical protein [Alcanivorax sp.]
MKALFATLALVLPGLALADSAPYLGIQAQYSRLDISTADFQQQPVANIDNRDYRYAVRIGLQNDLRRYSAKAGRNTLGVEFGYIDFGETSITVNGNKRRGDADGFELAMIGSTEVYYNTHLYGRFGGFSWNADGTFTGYRVSVDGEDLLAGAGILYFIGPLQIRGGYDYYKLEHHRLDVYSLGAQFRF